jgi:hypothetical protein
MQNSIGSAAAAIKRLLRLDDRIIQALMPNGDTDRQHYVGGYLSNDGKSEAQRAYDEDTDGWTVIGD